MKNRYFIFAVFILTWIFSNKVAAGPAYPYKINVVSKNGKTIGIYMHGDEYQKYAVTKDGYTLINDSNEWWYAKKVDNGNIGKSSFCLVADEDETEELKNFKKDCPLGIVPKRVDSYEIKKIRSIKNTSSKKPVVGEYHALVILMQYPDVPFKKTKEDFEKLFNSLNYRNNGVYGSVRDYYNFASQGQLDYISDIYGPYTSKYMMAFYGSNDMVGGSDSNPLELCIEAVKNLPPDIDYTIYDNNNDGVVDNVHIIFAGYGEDAGASSNAIWSHEYPHQISLIREVGYSLAGYSCSPELRGNSGSNITYIGPICHELGHALGADDYYDTNYSNGGSYDGTGKWDIMASGSWNDFGRTPANFNPYVRSSVYGWNKQIVLERDKNIIMPRMENDNVDETVIYKLETESEGDYFLIENRQQYKFDESLPGEGLMIYHVHPKMDIYSSTNSVNATHPQGLYPVCASYSNPNKKNYGNINSPECPFPGSKDVRIFSPDSFPAAIAWNGSSAKVSLSDITIRSDGSVTFTTSSSDVTPPPTPDIPVEEYLIFKESFENGIKDKISITSMIGNEKWKVYKQGVPVTKSELIPAPTDGTNIFMLFSGKDNSISESEAKGLDIEVDNGRNYSIAFDVSCSAYYDSPSPNFRLNVEDEFGEYNIYKLDKINDKWTHVEIPLVFAGKKIRFKLYGQIYSGGIFIDNVQFKTEPIGPEYIRGDANGDGEVNMYDVIFIMNYILGTPAPTFDKEAADVNKDGKINISDIMFIVNFIKNGEFPDEE